MKRIMLSGKIHRARVTEADLDYEGSLALDGGFMEAAGLIPFEKVHVYNVSNGERFSTYLIQADRGSGKVAVYGAAAHKAGVGDILIIVAFAVVDEAEIPTFKPKVLILGEKNRIIGTK